MAQDNNPVSPRGSAVPQGRRAVSLACHRLHEKLVERPVATRLAPAVCWLPRGAGITKAYRHASPRSTQG